MDKNQMISETMEHVMSVQKHMGMIAMGLIYVAGLHDQSKMRDPELSTFIAYTDKLRGMTYGSDEYKKCLAEMKPALDHHYAHNRHHPEHFANGINGMNIIDLIEMFCDWKAATLRHADGDIGKSIMHNAKRFNMSKQLVDIFVNSVSLF